MRLFGVGGRLEGPAARLIAAVMVYLVLSFVPSALADLPPPTIVTYNSLQIHLPAESTVGTLFHLQSIDVKIGRLLDVTGGVLKPEAYPPEVFVNGVSANTDTALHSGDQVELRGGADVTEPSIIQTYSNAGGNPQFKLGEGSIVVKRGLVSGAILPVATMGKGPPQVALTFDDGPDPRWTPEVLDILKKAGIKATFFVIGWVAQHNPELIKRELSEGMIVGDHSWSHPHLGGRDESFVHTQLGLTRDVLKKMGADVTVFRPPYGSYGGDTVEMAKKLGMRTIVWSIDPSDYRRPGVGAIVNRVMSQIQPGSIILMHDGGGDRSQTVAALKTIIEQLKHRGYGFSVLR